MSLRRSKPSRSRSRRQSKEPRSGKDRKDGGSGTKGEGADIMAARGDDRMLVRGQGRKGPRVRGLGGRDHGARTGTSEGSEGGVAAAWKPRRGGGRAGRWIARSSSSSRKIRPAGGRVGRWIARSSTTIIGGAGSRGRMGGGGVASDGCRAGCVVGAVSRPSHCSFGDGNVVHRLYGAGVCSVRKGSAHGGWFVLWLRRNGETRLFGWGRE